MFSSSILKPNCTTISLRENNQRRCVANWLHTFAIHQIVKLTNNLHEAECYWETGGRLGSKEIQRLLRNSEVNYHVRKSRSVVPHPETVEFKSTISRLIPLWYILLLCPKLCLGLRLPLRLPSGLFFLVYPIKILHAFPNSSMPSELLDFWDFFYRPVF
jgi:hypothetical protein